MDKNDYFDTHTFVTKILNKYLRKLSDLISEKKEIMVLENSVWVKKTASPDRFIDFRNDFFDVFPKTINIEKLKKVFIDFIKIVSLKIDENNSKTNLAVEKILFELFEEVDYELNTNYKKDLLSEYKNELKRKKDIFDNIKKSQTKKEKKIEKEDICKRNINADLVDINTVDYFIKKVFNPSFNEYLDKARIRKFEELKNCKYDALNMGEKLIYNLYITIDIVSEQKIEQLIQKLAEITIETKSNKKIKEKINQFIKSVKFTYNYDFSHKYKLLLNAGLLKKGSELKTFKNKKLKKKEFKKIKKINTNNVSIKENKPNKLEEPLKPTEKNKKETIAPEKNDDKTKKDYSDSDISSEEESKKKQRKKNISKSIIATLLFLIIGLFKIIKYIFRKPLLIFVIILVILLFYLHDLSNQDEVVQDFETITKIDNVTTYVDKPLSFANYLSPNFEYSSEELVLQGFLERKIDWQEDGSGTHLRFLVDEEVNSILLRGNLALINTFIPDVGRTKEIYSVTGTFNKRFGELEFLVSNIVESEEILRDKESVVELKTIKEEVPVNRTVAKYPLLRNLVYKIFNKDIFCEDGTALDECSETKPLFCTLYGLKENPVECGCIDGLRLYQKECIPIVSCVDGTLSPECSEERKMQCVDGVFVFNPKICGCPKDFIIRSDTCVATCEDGTAYDECSKNKPEYCDGGIIIDKSSLCGCPSEYIKEGESCISKYQTQPKTVTFEYILNGRWYELGFVVYKGLNDYVSNIPRSISYQTVPPTTKDFTLKNIDNKLQVEYILPLVKEIESITNDKDEQAKIAISLVQNIPYDWVSFETISAEKKYAYQVLYDQKGVCGEKSELLALILRELGFGVALFNYNLENHMALGIKCPKQYVYLDTSYCFVETTAPTIITDSYSEYVGAGTLSSRPEIIIISEGLELKNVKEEYEDVLLFNEIQSMGYVLSPYYYNKWLNIVNKYGLEVGN